MGRSHGRKSLGRKVLDYGLLTVLALLFFAPIYYLVIGSLKPTAEVLDGFAGFLPVDLSLDNYATVLRSFSSTSTGYFFQFFLNSFLISAVVVGLGLVVNSMAAYSFARMRWAGRDRVFLLVVVLVIVPFESVAVPMLYMMQGQRDTLLVQMVPFIANAFSIFLFYTFFLDSNPSIEEAARLDGLGPYAVFFRVVVPNSKPVFATVAILTFMTSWGQYLWPSLVTTDASVRPLPLQIGVFSSRLPVDWGALFAFGVLMVAPVVIVFLVFQRFFVQSVAASAVKG